MSDATTIKLSRKTKAALEEEQLDGETFDDTVSRLVGASNGTMWTEEEIRGMARQEAKDMIRQYS